MARGHDCFTAPFVRFNNYRLTNKTLITCLIIAAAFFVNTLTKGSMKSVGVVFKQAKSSYPEWSMKWVGFIPTIMNMVFNTGAIFVPLLGRYLGYIKAAYLGALIQMAALLSCSISPTSLPILQMGLLDGLGFAFTYHSVIIIMNQVKSEKNGLINGISLGGNSLGAIMVSYLIGTLFEKYTFSEATMRMASVVVPLVLAITFLYWICQHVEQEYLRSEERLSFKEVWKRDFWNWQVMKDPIYINLCLSQTFNAIGYVGFTAFFIEFVSKVHMKNDIEALHPYTTVMVADLFARLIIPGLTDFHVKSRPYVYMVGCVGCGISMLLLQHTSVTDEWLFSLCAVIGFFGALFIGTWNSLIKDLMSAKYFSITYTHSLSWAGVAQFAVITLMTFVLGKDDFRLYFYVFSVILMLAALPIGFILVYLKYFPSHRSLDIAEEVMEMHAETNDAGVINNNERQDPEGQEESKDDADLPKNDDSSDECGEIVTTSIIKDETKDDEESNMRKDEAESRTV